VNDQGLKIHQTDSCIQEKAVWIYKTERV